MAGQYFCFYAQRIHPVTLRRHGVFAARMKSIAARDNAAESIVRDVGECQPVTNQKTPAAFGSGFSRCGQRIVYDLLRLAHDGLQMRLVAETLCVNLIDVFRAGGTGREPPAGRHHF